MATRAIAIKKNVFGCLKLDPLVNHGPARHQERHCVTGVFPTRPAVHRKLRSAMKVWRGPERGKEIRGRSFSEIWRCTGIGTGSHVATGCANQAHPAISAVASFIPAWLGRIKMTRRFSGSAILGLVLVLACGPPPRVVQAQRQAISIHRITTLPASNPGSDHPADTCVGFAGIFPNGSMPRSPN